MKALLSTLLIAAAAVALALVAQGDNGYVLLILPRYRVELGLNTLVVGLLLLFGALHWLLRGLRAARGLPLRVRTFRELRARDRAAKRFLDALRLLYEGRYGHALRAAAEAHQLGYAPGLAALMASRAAKAMHEGAKEDEWLERAGQDATVTGARAMVEAESLVAAGQHEAALLALERLYAAHGRHIAALRVELRARQGLGQWQEVLRLTRQLEKRGGLSPILARELKSKAHREVVADCRGEAGRLLAWLKDMPGEEGDDRFIRAAAQALIDEGELRAAGELIETRLEKHWDGALILLYGRLTRSPGDKDSDSASQGASASVDATAVARRLARAEAWLNRYPRDAELLLTLGRLCLAQALWGKARSYLEASLALVPAVATRLELARLLDRLGDEAAANRHYRAAAEAN